MKCIFHPFFFTRIICTAVLHIIYIYTHYLICITQRCSHLNPQAILVWSSTCYIKNSTRWPCQSVTVWQHVPNNISDGKNSTSKHDQKKKKCHMTHSPYFWTQKKKAGVHINGTNLTQPQYDIIHQHPMHFNTLWIVSNPLPFVLL